MKMLTDMGSALFTYSHNTESCLFLDYLIDCFDFVYATVLTLFFMFVYNLGLLILSSLFLALWLLLHGHRWHTGCSLMFAGNIIGIFMLD